MNDNEQSAESGMYMESLRHLIESEMQDEWRRKSTVVLDCLVCQKYPSKSCPVCYPQAPEINNDGSKTPSKLKKFPGYTTLSKSKHKHNGQLYVDLVGDPISEQQINENKRVTQIKKMHSIILELRKKITDLDNEKTEALSALKQLSLVCNNLKNRHKHMDMEIQHSSEVICEKDFIISELETMLQSRDQEIHDLKVKCNNAETGRSHSAKETQRLRNELAKLKEQMQLYSISVSRSKRSGNTSASQRGMNQSAFSTTVNSVIENEDDYSESAYEACDTANDL